ncbi:MAG: putative Ig domain-containing protein, partial [Planctomycetes bacterium]|nr:putative Ig domain-containing protein [Planctomycetota bacterium]
MKFSIKSFVLIIVLALAVGTLDAQVHGTVNEALSGTASNSGGGSGVWGPTKLNNNDIAGSTNDCWTSGGGWVEIQWSSAVSVASIKVWYTRFRSLGAQYCFHKGDVQYWNGSAYVLITAFDSGSATYGTNMDQDIFFSPVSTTRIRINNMSFTGSSNVMIQEFQVFNPAGLTITNSATLPDAGENTAYTETFVAVQGTTPYTWSMPTGTLPNGLSFTQVSNDYVLSGTPAAGSTGTYNFTVQVNDNASATDSKAFTLFVDEVNIATASTLPDGGETVAYSQDITAVNGTTPYTWALASGSLPSGLTFTQVGNLYRLAGTPATGTTGTYTFDVQVTDNNSVTTTKTFDLYIDWAPGALTYPLTEQDPSTTGFTSSTSTSPYNRGWRFTCNSGGVTVYRLGSNMPSGAASVTKTVSLFNYASNALLGQVVTGPGTGWQWTDLTSPVLLQNGQDYVVVVHSSNGYYYDSTVQSSWLPTGDIQYVQYVSGSTSNPSTFPTSSGGTNDQYGVADIGYAKGLTITTAAQLPSGAEGTSYNTTIVAGFGTPAYSWQNLSGTGALPSGLSL